MAFHTKYQGTEMKNKMSHIRALDKYAGSIFDDSGAAAQGLHIDVDIA